MKFTRITVDPLQMGGVPSPFSWGVLFGFHRPVNHYYFCQHPGSPGCPQQLLRVRIFFPLFLITSHAFFHGDIGAWRFVKKARALGRPGTGFVTHLLSREAVTRY